MLQVKSHADFRDAVGSGVLITSISFNQDSTCFACGTTNGFRVYKIGSDTTQLKEFARRECPGWVEGCCKSAAMLFRTNVFGLVLGKDSRRVRLYDDRQKKQVAEIVCRQEIRNVVLARDIIAIATSHLVQIHDIETTKQISSTATCANPEGLCAVVSDPTKGKWKVAVPGGTAGAAKVLSSTSREVDAFKTKLSALALSDNGELLGCATEAVQMLRVFATSSGAILYQFELTGGSPYVIASLAFFADTRLIATTMTHLEIFRLHPCAVQSSSGVPSPCSSPMMRLFNGRRASEEMERHRMSTFARRSVASGISAAINHGREVVQDAFKFLPKSPAKGAAIWQQSIRLPSVEEEGGLLVAPDNFKIRGPVVGVCREEGGECRAFLVHPNGLLYEIRFDAETFSIVRPKFETLGLAVKSVVGWFAPRLDFAVEAVNADNETASCEISEDVWHILP